MEGFSSSVAVSGATVLGGFKRGLLFAVSGQAIKSGLKHIAIQRDMKKLPKFLKKYFWDVDFGKLDAQTHPKYVLGRLLEYGDEKAISWMKRHFTKDQVEDILFHYRSVSPQSANFWAVVFNINKKKVLCLQKPYLEIRRKLWPY